ncbi:hypothetical protein BpHYR1_019543 [Brachionus plicatilis]|uniref:Uncharacterized protein n=1 Tax=Brachionus plicatilis TaxID=10195 RepID=A0A3M7R9I9_BRAPC|nr:hypothetical protein BpHYR1_019543 [Brachionus plicatilis]
MSHKFLHLFGLIVFRLRKELRHEEISICLSYQKNPDKGVATWPLILFTLAYGFIKNNHKIPLKIRRHRTLETLMLINLNNLVHEALNPSNLIDIKILFSDFGQFYLSKMFTQIFSEEIQQEKLNQSSASTKPFLKIHLSIVHSGIEVLEFCLFYDFEFVMLSLQQGYKFDGH